MLPMVRSRSRMKGEIGGDKIWTNEIDQEGNEKETENRQIGGEKRTEP